jgi:hypothetical protein
LANGLWTGFTKKSNIKNSKNSCLSIGVGVCQLASVSP